MPIDRYQAENSLQRSAVLRGKDRGAAVLMQASQQMRTAKLAAHSFVKLRRCKVLRFP